MIHLVFVLFCFRVCERVRGDRRVRHIVGKAYSFLDWNCFYKGLTVSTHAEYTSITLRSNKRNCHWVMPTRNNSAIVIGWFSKLDGAGFAEEKQLMSPFPERQEKSIWCKRKFFFQTLILSLCDFIFMTSFWFKNKILKMSQQHFKF